MSREPLSGRIRSFLFTHADAARAFPSIDPWRVVLAMLASTRPELHWQGTLVFEVATPAGNPDCCCLCIQGPLAQEVGDRLVETFQAAGVPVRGTLVEDPEPIGPVVEVKDRTWS